MQGTFQASPYGHTAEIGNDDNPFIVKKQPNKCRDPLFAVLLYVNVAAIVGLFIAYGVDVIRDSVAEDGANAGEATADYSGFAKAAIGSAAIGTILSGVMLQVLICIPQFLVKFALIFNVFLSGAFAVYGFMIGSAIVGIIGLIFFAIMCCYAYAVWSRIPFATANLKTGTTAVRANCGVSIIAYIFTALGFAWNILWAGAAFGVLYEISDCAQNENGETVCDASNPNYGILFLLFLSLFFTAQVIQNCVHVTVAGVVGSWWFEPSQSGFCSAAVCSSFFRTMTTSFGSICFGSLLVAIIQAVRQLAETARQNDELGSALACCIDCILGCLESLLEYFNKWAFVYVGVYGFGYCEAGKNVMTLFRDRGWEAVIADDLVGMVLFLLSLVTGLITGGCSVLFVTSTDWFDVFIAANDENTAKIVVFVVGLIIGLLLCSIIMSVIASSVNTTIVLFADAPAEFEKHYPELSREMRSAYAEAHPGSI